MTSFVTFQPDTRVIKVPKMLQLELLCLYLQVAAVVCCSFLYLRIFRQFFSAAKSNRRYQSLAVAFCLMCVFWVLMVTPHLVFLFLDALGAIIITVGGQTTPNDHNTKFGESTLEVGSRI